MARYASSYAGEKRTEHVALHLTPSERATLESGAVQAQVSLSQHARELCLRRSIAAQIVAGTRRNPDARALINQLMAIGNNVNQLTRHCNTERTAPQRLELKMTTDMLKAALEHVLKL